MDEERASSQPSFEALGSVQPWAAPLTSWPALGAEGAPGPGKVATCPEKMREVRMKEGILHKANILNTKHCPLF